MSPEYDINVNLAQLKSGVVISGISAVNISFLSFVTLAGPPGATDYNALTNKPFSYAEVAGPASYSLPTAVGWPGRQIQIINTGTGNVTVNAVTGQKIGNTSAATVSAVLTAGNAVTVLSNGTNWRIV